MSKNKEAKPEETQTNEPVKEPTKAQQVERLDKEIEGYEATIAEFNTQLKALNVDLQEEDALINKKVNEELDAFPESSPKGLLEKIYKLNLPKRGQLQESIDKVKIALEHTRGKKNKVVREKAKLTEEIKEQGLNTLVERLCETFKGALDKYLDWEDSFHTLKEKIAEIGLLDQMFFNRVDNSKYSDFYNQVFGLVLMKPASLPGLTANHFINTVQNIGKDTENPLKAGRFSREETKPIHRDITGKTEAPQAPDAAAEEKLSAIFEEGPTIPTVYE